MATTKYQSPKPYKVDQSTLDKNGYGSVEVTNQKSTKIRGTGAATKGTTASSKMG